MSWAWYLYTTASPADVVKVDSEYQAALKRYLDEHDSDDELAEAGPGGPPPPTVERVAEYRATFGETLDPAVAARLRECRTTIGFDYIRPSTYDSPLQVSVLQFWLEALAPCIFDWGDLSLELGETTLAKLATQENCGPLVRKPRTEPRPTKPKASSPNNSKRARNAPRPAADEQRSAHILEHLANAQHDPDAAIDISRTIQRLSAHAQRYVVLLINVGPCSDAVAAEHLSLTSDAVKAVVDELEAALRD